VQLQLGYLELQISVSSSRGLFRQKELIKIDFYDFINHNIYVPGEEIFLSNIFIITNKS
jgi:hypothetical protein